MRKIPHFLRLICPLFISAYASGLNVTGYSEPTNDRFLSGFPGSPVENTSGSIFGQGLDWSGVGWTSGFVRKGYGFVSPRHYMSARHFGGGSTIVTFSQTQSLQTASQQGLENVNYGEIHNGNPDIQLGTLSSQMTNIQRYGLLDLNANSSTNSLFNYNNLPVYVYGHGGNETNSTRVGETAITVSGQQSRFLTPRSDLQLVTFDSGSPVFAKWTNPNGDLELALVGNHAATNNDFNFHNFFCTKEIFDELNTRMNDDGFALRIVGNSGATWTGNNNRPHQNNAWSPSGGTSDEYVSFDPATASNFNVNVSSNHNLRGLYFKSNGGSSAFSFSGSQTLTIGRGGITNYDDDLQTFTADLALSASQFWDAGPGGVSVADLNTTTNSTDYFLEIMTGGASTISGNITGGGGIALTSGSLTLSGNSTYTGTTWAHEGNLIIEGDIDSSASLTIGSPATLSGTGSVPLIQGAGSISPGNSPGILTAESVDPSDGLDFDFEFTAASAPDFSNAGSSINDLLRVTDGTPFSNPLDTNNTIRILLDAGSLSNGQIFKGGFFTDSSSDFIGSISSADFEFYIADGSGSINFGGQTYSVYDGPYLFTLSTEAQTADFGEGNVSGRIMQLVVTPDVTKYEGWKISLGLSGAAALNTADDDFDLIPLIHEFAFGGNLNVSDADILPTISLTKDSEITYLDLVLTRPIGLQGIIYIPKTTDDVANWPTDSTGIVDDDPTPTNNGDGTETLVYRRSQPVSGADQAFIRIDVSEN